MKIFQKIYNLIYQRKHKNEPWLSYYSREERSIKFTKKSIYHFMLENAEKYKNMIALNYFDNKISYRDLMNNIDIASRALREFGIKKGDIVTICLPNMPEAIYIFYACNKIGAVCDIIHPLSSKEQMKFYLNESKSRFLFLVDFNYEKFKEIKDNTLVYKTILVSPRESMPCLISLGYFITRTIKIKKPLLSNHDYMRFKEFFFYGILNKKEFEADVKSNDLALILHSGGTTGSPKGIMISNYSFNALAQQGAVSVIDVRPSDKIVTILPIFHGFGLGICVHTPLCLGLEVILIPEYNAKSFYKMFKKDKPHVILGVPTLWEGMMSNNDFNKVNMQNLKYIISGGDYLTVNMEMRINHFLRMHGANIKIAKGYGMTESVAATCYTFPGTNLPGSIGIPMVGNTYKICHPETNEELPIGEEGEICVHGPTLMMGYLNNKEETKKILRKHLDGKLWLHTGDIGYISLEGIVYYTGRIKRMIVVSGFNVYPSVIEEVLVKHEAVDKACVIAIPHPYKMHVPKAIIVLKKGYHESPKLLEDLKDYCDQNLSVYERPKEFSFCESFPKTLYNKIDYKKLEEMNLK